MIKHIQQQEMVDQIEKGSIFNGKWNRLLYGNVKDEAALKCIEGTPDFLQSAEELLSPSKRAFKEDKVYDGFNAKKQFKYQQYNRLIQMQNRGKTHFDPHQIILGDYMKQKKQKIKNLLSKQERLAKERQAKC